MPKKRGLEVVYPIDRLHAKTASRLDRSTKSFPLLNGGLDRKNRPITTADGVKHGLQYGNVMTRVRQLGAGTGRGFASELGVPVREHVSFPYQRLPLEEPNSEYTHSYEFLVSFRSGNAVLGLLHLIDFGNDYSPGNLDPVPNQAIVFDSYTGTVKWLRQQSGQEAVSELGNGDLDTMEYIFENFVNKELSELDSTPVILPSFTHQRARKVGSTVRSAIGFSAEFTRALRGTDMQPNGGSSYGQPGMGGQ